GTPDLVATNDGATTISVLLNQATNVAISLLTPPAVGTTVQIRITSANDGGNPYVAAFAFGTTPGFDLADHRHVPLNDDALLALSLTPNNGFVTNNVGTLNAAGQATVLLNVP